VEVVRRDAGSGTALEEAPERAILALLPEEPAGRISTGSAGAISFWAALSRRPDEERRGVPVLGDPPPGARFYSLARTRDAASGNTEISCEIRALHVGQLTGALEAVLRSVAAHAALTEAVLETRAVRLANPSAPSPLVETLARQLSDAGLRPSFGPSWTPAPGADLSVGTRGLEDVFETVLATHPTWRLPPG
jgi:hypothetical protein